MKEKIIEIECRGQMKEKWHFRPNGRKFLVWRKTDIYRLSSLILVKRHHDKKRLLFKYTPMTLGRELQARGKILKALGKIRQISYPRIRIELVLDTL